MVPNFTRRPRHWSWHGHVQRYSDNDWVFNIHVPYWTRRAATAPFLYPNALPVPMVEQLDLALSSGFLKHNSQPKSSSIFWLNLAEIYKLRIATPGVDITPCSANSLMTRSGLAPWFINLVNSHNDWDIRRFWVVNSFIVCASPHTAATTKMVIICNRCPRARLEVKAACPGVSKKVNLLPFSTIC